MKRRGLRRRRTATRTSDAGKRRGGVLIIVENLPVPFDRRVWLECQALVAEGHHVSVVCPKGSGDPSREVVDGVGLYKYRQHAAGSGAVSYLIEYLHSFLMTGWLTMRVAREHSFDVIQACNPPDIFWPIGVIARAFGVSYVFDHHDLCPELFRSRFPNGSGLFHRLLLSQERTTHRVATHVISTNESYRRLAIERSGKDPKDVTVVRSGPELSRLVPVPPQADLRRGRSSLVVYLGVMGPQDGVDNVLKAADFIVHRLNRTDIAFTLIGSGDCYDELVAQRDELALQGFVEFTGRVPDATLSTILSTADIGLSPDPLNELNDLSTMNKTMEYMAFSLPVVAFDLHETKISAGDAAVYAIPGDIADFAQTIVDLVDDDARRLAMGQTGRARVETSLAWQYQQANYVAVYRDLIPTHRHPDAVPNLAIVN